VWPNHQGIEMTGARVRRPHGCVGWSRGASFQSAVEPARRRFVKPFSYAFCFFRRPLASITYADFHHFGTLSPRCAASENRAMMTGPKHLVQPNAAAGQTSGNNLIPGSHKFRQARRAAAGFNHSLEPSPTMLAHPLTRLTSLARRGSLQGR
jgi:hypothetical protein